MPFGYSLDKMTGRLVGSTSKAAFNPQAFKPVEVNPILKASKSERAVPVRAASDLRHALHVHEPIKQTEVLGKFPDVPRYRKLQDKQRIMMRPDGKLVWQKLPSDLPMYRATMALCAVGLVWMGSVFYKMAFNIKPNKD